MKTILHFFYKITNERGTKNRVYIRSYKMVLWPIRARVLFELFYNKTFLEEEENQYMKRKLKVMYSVVLVMAFLAAENEKLTLGRFATGRFWPFT